MAKPNYQFERRQREIAKQKKKAEKASEKASKKAAAAASPGERPAEPAAPQPTGNWTDGSRR